MIDVERIHLEALYGELSRQRGVSLLKLVNGTIKSQAYQVKIVNDIKVSKVAKIRNQYNKVTHLTQDTNGRVTNSQLYSTNENQGVSPFSTDDHKAQINRRAQRHNKHKTEKNIKEPQRKYCLGTVSKIFYWRA